MRSLLLHGVLSVGLAVASVDMAAAKRCEDDAAVAAARAAADAECDCATAASHGEYQRCVSRVVKELAASGDLPRECRGEVTSCAARSICGKPGSVTCCRVDKKGKTKCSIKSSADKCKAPKGGQACAGSGTSCCDSCGAGSPDGAFVCQGTTTTTAPPVTTSTTTPSTTSTTASTTTTTVPPTTSTTAPPVTTTTTSSTTTTTIYGSPSRAFLRGGVDLLE